MPDLWYFSMLLALGAICLVTVTPVAAIAITIAGLSWFFNRGKKITTEANLMFKPRSPSPK